MSLAKKLLIIGAGLAASLCVVRSVGQSANKSYYSGDAIYWQGHTLIATTNIGWLEIFQADQVKMSRLLKLQPSYSAQSLTNEFNAVLFSQENSRLYVYASSGNRLFKYLFNVDNSLTLVNQIADNTWDWYGRLDLVNGQVATIGSKGVKFWNSDLQVVDYYQIANVTNPYNIRVSRDGKFIFNVAGDTAQVFDRQSRQIIHSIALYSANPVGNRQLAYDDNAAMFYLIDDQALKQFDLSGNLYRHLSHDSRYGYDAVLSGDDNYLYVSNGTSVVKADKTTFKIGRGLENVDLQQAGAWAMGLKRVALPDGGEEVVVFDSTGILVTDSNLKIQALYWRVPGESEPAATEQLFLRVDSNQGTVHQAVGLSGGGWWPNEQLTILFADTQYTTQTDSAGRFQQTVFVPGTIEPAVDIKVVGQNSGRQYNLGFKIIH